MSDDEKTCGGCAYYRKTSPHFGDCMARSPYPHTSREVGRDFWAGMCSLYSPAPTRHTDDTPASQDASAAEDEDRTP